MTYRILLFIALFASVIACKKDDGDDMTPSNNNGNNLPAECTAVFQSSAGTHTFTAGVNTGGPGVDFQQSQTYDATITADGKISIVSDNGTVEFLAADIDRCEEHSHETNVFYVTTTLNMIFQVEGETMTLVISNTDGQITLTKAAGPDLSLISEFAGTYNVASTSHGTHDRGTVIINSDGSIDFDNGVMFATTSYELVSDRKDCCNGIWIDMAPYPIESYPRAELHLDANNTTLKEVHYLPEYPSISNRVVVLF